MRYPAQLGKKAKQIAGRQLDPRRFQVVVAMLLAYAFAMAPLYRWVGDSVFLLSLFPLTVAASLLGTFSAAVVAMLLSALNLYLYSQMGGEWAEVVRRGSIYSVLHLLVGAGVGRWSDLHSRLKAELKERLEVEGKLEFLAYHDPLTGLANRLLLQDRLEVEIAQARRDQGRFGVLSLSLDRFRRVNDSMGHETGDRLLIEVGHRLQRSLRKTDTVARFGSDSYVILFPQLRQESDVSNVSEKLIEAIGHPFFVNGQEIQLTARIGIALYPADGTDPDTLLRNADAALSRARIPGAQTIQIFSPQIHQAAQQRMELETGIRKALQQEELFLHYQPVVESATGAIVSFEALLRWNNPHLGNVTPDVFIPIAEDTGAISAIGDFVFRTAIKQLRQWRELGFPELRMAVNLSPRQLKRPDLHSTFTTFLKEMGIEAYGIDLEITESSLLTEDSVVIENLKSLRAAGFGLAIDDFGTGYSCLSYLKRLPFTCLKVDRSFIRQVNTDPEYATITYAIIAMAKALRLKTIAEGVETHEQCAFLWQWQCDEIQGFLFNKPMPAEEATRMLADISERRRLYHQNFLQAQAQEAQIQQANEVAQALPQGWLEHTDDETMPPVEAEKTSTTAPSHQPLPASQTEPPSRLALLPLAVETDWTPTERPATKPKI